MTRGIAAAGLAVALLTGTSAAAGPDGGCSVAQWPQPRQSACATASLEDAVGLADARQVRLAWSASLGGQAGNPVVGDDRVFVTAGAAGSSPPRLDALDRATGNLLWSVPSGRPGGLTPLLDGRFLLRLSATHQLTRYDPNDGRPVWRRSVPSSFEAPLPQQTSTDGTWYQSQGEDLVAYSELHGDELWSTPLICFTCTVAVADGRVYAAGARRDFQPGRLFAFDAATGKAVWSAAGLGEFTTSSSPMLERGTVFVVTTRSEPNWIFYVEAYRATDGQPLWHRQLNDPGEVPGFDPGTSPAVGDGVVVYPLADGFLYAVDAGTGALHWKTAIGATESSPAIANGVVWIVDGAGRLTALAVSDGHLLWSAPPIDGLQASSPVVADGLVLVGTPDGRLLAYGAP